jgi:hypothetical protein
MYQVNSPWNAWKRVCFQQNPGAIKFEIIFKKTGLISIIYYFELELVLLSVD